MEVSSIKNNSRREARLRVSEKLYEMLGSCRLCPRACGINRLSGEKGFCKAGSELELAYVGPHQGEEPPISGIKGSGTIFLKHCTMSCVFCQNWQISQETNNIKSETQNFASLQNTHNLNLVSPTQYLPHVLELISDTKLPIVYNTNGYDSVDVLTLLDGIVDIYLPDIKYGDNALAKKYSRTDNYVEYNQAALREMYRQVGLLQTDADGIAVRGMIIRHLVLPGHLENSKRCLDFIAGLSTELTVSIMAQYSPQYEAARYPEINRKITAEEYAEIVDYAGSLGLENCFVQEPESQEVFLPDFERDKPFN
jgi:putative pyruvate formate lyase activating enzyme